MSAFLHFGADRYRLYSCLLLVSVFGLTPWPAATAQTRESSHSASVLHELNEAVEDLVVRRASLEDTYMALVRQAEHGMPRRLTAVAA